MSASHDTVAFVVIGAQRTGTNLLREILNTNPAIAMLGEVLTESPAPAHWDNFTRTLPRAEFPPATAEQAIGLLDRYLGFVDYRIRNHWIDGDKSRARAIGLDIKYNQLRDIAPHGWPATSSPFLVRYLCDRQTIFIHATRRNLIHCAISAIVAAQRNLWHDYAGTPIERSFEIDSRDCLERARAIARDRAEFVRLSDGIRLVECRYEDLVDDLGRAEANGSIPPASGPLTDIANALGVEFEFRNEGRLRKAINVPYSQLIANHCALVHAIKDSEFAEFAATLE